MLMMMDDFDEYIVIDFDLRDGDIAYVEQNVAAGEMRAL